MATQRSYGQATFWDKLGYLYVMGNALSAGLIASFQAPFRDPKTTASGAGRYILYSIVRGLLNSANIAQLQFASAPTTEVYNQLAASKGFTPHSINHPLTNCKSHWIGSPSARKVLLYLHGGGYTMPATAPHLDYMYHVAKAINESSDDKNSIAVLVLAYGLVPDVAYPKPLAQASDCLRYLMEEGGRQPSDIILVGDSAGGNLALSVLSHLLHPHPSSSVPKINLQSPLAGALLISPWVEFDTSRPSFRHNEYLDVSSAKALASWAPGILRDMPSDQYIEPATADVRWWTGLDTVVSHALIWGGGGEVLIDGIKVVMERMKQANPDIVETVVSHNMCHEQMVVNKMLGYPEGESEAVTNSWIKARLQST